MPHSLESLSHNNKNLLDLLNAFPDKHSDHFIEYGIQTQPGGYMSAFRIRRINTPGGLQFRLSQLLPSRGESSLAYAATADGIFIDATKAITHYHRPTPLREHLKAMRKEQGIDMNNYSWFSYDYKPEKDFLFATRPENYLIPGIKEEDITTFTLG